MNLPIYLDHSASTEPWPAVLEHFASQLKASFANPSSMHRLGRQAEKSLDDSRQQMAVSLGCHRDELILTSGGSESINLAIKGFAAANPRLGNRIITSCGEHAATVETLNYLRLQGFEIVEIPLLPGGQIDLGCLAEALARPAALISLIHVSNETGSVNPVEAVVRLRNQLQPAAAIHLDAVQSLGRLPVNFHKMGIDLLSGSGHKVGAPKGIGWLIVRRGIRLAPQIHGGGQQHGLRSGTENPPLSAALALAVRLTASDLAEKTALVGSLRQHLLASLSEAGVSYEVLSPADGVPHILAIAFPGLRGETLLHALEAREIYVSTGSACSSGKKKHNPVLRAMGFPDKLAACAIRISLSASNTKEEMILAAQAIAESCRILIAGK